MTPVLTDTHAGWRFNFDHHSKFSITRPSLEPWHYHHWLAAGPALWETTQFQPITASTIAAEDLKTKPFYWPFDNSRLYDSDSEKGSAEALEEEVQYRLLSTAIPAMSYGAGANLIEEIERQGNENFDMMTQKEASNQWPREDGDWYHSDFRDAALSHTIPMYEKMIELNSLDQL